MNKYTNDKGFMNIVEKYYRHPKVRELNNYAHHGTTRLDHSRRVAYYTYKVTKKLKLNYKSATKAALLHDLFYDEVENESARRKLTEHPSYALNNARRYFDLTPLEEDIIYKHMFPITRRLPKYIESWIVDGVDDCCAIYERLSNVKVGLLKVSHTVILLFLTLKK